ncbi:Chromosome partition protein Smc [Planctomycetes bacterium CA13]|uniref:Chromosome partition protein Smc n=1 Tax=Novipirellula herctigrandis TaxID=2527986 RepID=A0A5C5Z9Q0_9BACT|nr:Chromosome partition protein Smc [Planctomycetes bacterium CA13]
MVARDDSLIRGSLIASLIFLVLSIALNFFLWFQGNLASADMAKAKDQLSTVNSNLKTLKDQSSLMKAMLGQGTLSEAEFDLLKQSASGDAEMEAIEQQFVQDMSLFGADEDAQDRNYPKLPEYLMNAIRSRNEQFREATEDLRRVRAQAESDVANARKAQDVAEQKAQDLQKKLDQENELFTQDRERINKEKEDTRDKLTTMEQDFRKFRAEKADETTKLSRKGDQLQSTIETQKLQLNQLRNDRFETAQGRIRFVRNDLVTVNLGSADALRRGITFGVIGGDETRLQDAKVKATIQITRILGAHLSEARVVARPEIEYPIIPNDMIYSPFWAPGRKVKIALAGSIDIDNDDRPDNEAIIGMINAAGADVVTGELDASIRFLVVDDKTDDPDRDFDEQQEQEIGRVKARARELGLTIIPAWKLQAYLKTIDDTLTTPLGSGVRGADFKPTSNVGANQRYPTSLPEIFTRQTEGVQRTNEILSP